MAAHITPATCTTKLTSKKHYEYPLALKEIVVKVSHPDHDGQVATLDALLINRFKLMGDFLSVMDEESDELQKFAFGVFDMEGKIKSKLVEHEHHKGSGCWGRELNDGMLIYVSTIHVEPEVRAKTPSHPFESTIVLMEVISYYSSVAEVLGPSSYSN